MAHLLDMSGTNIFLGPRAGRGLLPHTLKILA
jgi:hypothetical protein